MKHEIRLSGSGGQGLITAGIILARAAALYDNKNAVQSQSYGPEARGGASKAEVIISDNEINFPKVQRPDVLVALTEEALKKYSTGVDENCIIIVDSLMVKNIPAELKNVHSLPIIDTAANKVLVKMTANIVTLGALNKLCDLVSPEALEKAVIEWFPPKAKDKNVEALKAGAELI